MPDTSIKSLKTPRTPSYNKIVSRYVKKNAFFSILFAIVGLWLLQLFFSYLAEIEDLSDTYTYIEAIKYIGYRSPYFLEQFIPTGALLGAVVGLGLLANNSELIVMRSVGISIYRIVGWVLQPALLFVFVALGINQFILPQSNQLASQIRNPDKPLLTAVDGYWSLRQAGSSIAVAGNELADTSDPVDEVDTANENATSNLSSEIVFIDYADAEGNVGVVKRWQLDNNNNLVSALKAQNGHYINDNNANINNSDNTNGSANTNTTKPTIAVDSTSNNTASHEGLENTDAYLWQLNKVSEVHLTNPNVSTASSNESNEDSPSVELQTGYFGFANQQALLNKTTQTRAIMRLPISPSSVYLLTQRAEDLSLTELYQHYRFNLAQDTRSLEHELAFWQKLLSPFAILSLVIVACSFVFGSLRTHSLGLRIVMALLFGLLFSYLQDLSGFVSLATGISPLFMVILPIAASAILGLFLIKRQM